MAGATEFLVVKNRAYSKLAAAITAGATSLTVTAGEGALFPSTYPFHLTIDDEIVSVTDRSTDTMTIVRAQQGTSAATHSKNSHIALNITAKSVTDLNTAVNFIEKYADYGLAFYGKVTTATDATHFKVAGLAGLGTGWFKTASGTPYEIFVLQADGAAPEGEQTPVVAYTSSDGTFQHAALGAQLAVDDEVMIVHPLLASLGTKATAAASGAVTTTDYAIAYIKQIVTELQVVDTVVDGIQTDLDNATDGLGALKALIDAVHADLGDVGDTATADDLSDIATTSVLAKLRRILLRFSADAFAATIGGSSRTDVEAMFQALANYISDSGGAYSVSLDGSARTDIEAFHAALATMLGTRDQTVSAGVLADTESAFALLRRLATSGSLVHFGDITAVDAGVSSTIADLIGWEDDYFAGWWMMIVRDDGGAGAAPQGEYRQITSYTSSSGLMNHTAFSAADAVGDQAMLIHPLLYGLFAATRGSGPRSLETLGQEQDAELDVARGKYTKTMTGSEDDLYGESSDTEFCLLEFRADLHNMTEGDTIIFRVYTTEDGTERQISDDEANTFADEQSPARVEIIGSANQVWGREDISITAEQTTGTNREIVCYWRDAKRGS